MFQIFPSLNGSVNFVGDGHVGFIVIVFVMMKLNFDKVAITNVWQDQLFGLDVDFFSIGPIDFEFILRTTVDTTVDFDLKKQQFKIVE